MNKKANGSGKIIIIFLIVLIIVAIIIVIFIVNKNIIEDQEPLPDWSWFLKAQFENESLSDADVIITYSKSDEYGFRHYFTIKKDKIKKDIWTEIKLKQDCEAGDYLCVWIWNDYNSYVKSYCFPVRATIQKGDKSEEICRYPFEEANSVIMNQTHDIIDLPQVGKLEISSLNLEDKTFVLKSLNGTWKKPTLCLDWNIGIIAAGIEGKEEINESEKEYYKIKNHKCYKYHDSIEENGELVFTINYEKLEGVESFITLTVLDRDRDPNNIGDGLSLYYFDVNGKDLGGKNQVFNLI